MSGIASYNSFDYAPVEPVPVIASFDSQGKIMPIYVRIRGSKYRVMSYYTRCKFSNTIDFSCQIEVEDNRVVPLVLTYHLAECTWSIPATS